MYYNFVEKAWSHFSLPEVIDFDMFKDLYTEWEWTPEDVVEEVPEDVVTEEPEDVRTDEPEDDVIVEEPVYITPSDTCSFWYACND